MKKILALTATLLSVTGAAHAFGLEDPTAGSGPARHHEQMTKDAAKAAGFSSGAADSIAWTSHSVDSYHNSFLWWAKGGLSRFKVAKSTSDDLDRVHFDDLFDADKVRYMWRRYATGTMAGLMWAKEKEDVAAAQNILGVSLHAIQDFYSHSNWIDKAERRQKTYLNFTLAERQAMPLYTGADKLPPSQGIKPHGEVMEGCGIMKQPGVKQILDVACGAGSPFGNDSMCRSYDACNKGTSVNVKVQGIPIPPDFVYMAPAGIALDTKWQSDIAVKERGLNDMTGANAFSTASLLAQTASTQWLQTLEANMKKVPGGAQFWSEIKTKAVDEATRQMQFENYAQFPFQFLSAGEVPKTATSAEEYYLRVRLQTSNEGGSGTDSDIYLRPDGKEAGQKLLDYMPGALPILAYNDFEQGDDGVYVAGPFSKLPSSISLYNHSANTGDLLKGLGTTLKSVVSTAGNIVVGIFKGISGKEADFIGTQNKIWTPEELALIPTEAQAPGKVIKVPMLPDIIQPAGKVFSLEANGGDSGHYSVTGYILKTGESAESGPTGWREFEVRLLSLKCIKESKWDRGSSSDEPFVLSFLKALPGTIETYRTDPYDGVNDGDSKGIGKVYKRVRVPKDCGMLSFGVSFWEHDDESSSKRNELLDTFAGTVVKEAEKAERGLLSAIGAYVGEDWRLQRIEVYAWSRGGAVRGGTVCAKEANQWIKGRDSASFTLDASKLVNTGIQADDLLRFIPPAGQDPGTSTPTSTKTDPLTTTDPGTTTNPGGNTDPGTTTNPGTTTDPGGMTTFPTDPTGNPTNGNPANGNPTMGDPIKPNDGGFVPNPGAQNPATGTGGGGIGTGTFQTIGQFDMRLDDVQIVSGNTVRVFVTYKNIGQRQEAILGSAVTAIITDADGVGFGSNGNLYRASGALPEAITNTLRVEPEGEIKLSYLFPLPKGVTQLRSLTFYDNYGNSAPQRFNLTSANALRNVANAVAAAATSTGAVGGTGDFAELGPYDVRFDGIKKGRGNQLQAFVTLKNSSQKNLRMTASDLTLQLFDADGVSVRNIGNLYRASGGSNPEGISHTVTIEPESETKLRFLFPANQVGTPQRLVISVSKDEKRSYDLPAIP